MIDIHCHIIPGIDDGPKTMAESIELAKLAESEGITTIIATSHHQHPSFHNSGPSILRKVEELNEALKKENISINVLPGQEVRIHGEIVENLKLGDVLPITSDSSYVLVESPSNSIPRYTTTLFYEMQLQGYKPIIAHPERNKVFVEKPEKLYDLIVNGALTQVTASSVTGYLGKQIKKFSEQLIEADQVHFIASDAHNTMERPFYLKAAYHEIESTFGLDLVYQLQENAQILSENNHVASFPPQPIKRRKGLFSLFG